MSNSEKEEEEYKLRELVLQLEELVETPAGKSHEESIQSFVEQANSYADRIKECTTDEALEEILTEVGQKRTQWEQLVQLLSLATQMVDDDELVRTAEANLRKVADNLRAVADQQEGRVSQVFDAIREIAVLAEAGLKSFEEAESTAEKLEVYARVEEQRRGMLERMQGLQRMVADDDSGSEAATEDPGPGVPECQYVDDADEQKPKGCVTTEAQALGTGLSALTGSYGMSSGIASPYGSIAGTGGYGSGGYGGFGGGFGGWGSFGSQGCVVDTSSVPAASTSGSSADAAPAEPAAEAAAPAPPPEPSLLESSALVKQLHDEATGGPKSAKEQVAICLSDPEEGLLLCLRRSVAKVKEDDRFAAVHEDAGKLLEQMELAAGAVIPEALQPVYTDDMAGAEEKLKATVEPMRTAQWGGFYAKKHAWNVKKYDLYKRKGDMPWLKEEHEELAECAEVCKDVAEFLRKEAQGNIMDCVTALVAQTTRG